ncbi:Mu homology domain containing protein [Tylopilus felleus]
MISAFFIFNQKGEVLISRLYRTDFKRSIADVFRIQVSNSDVRSPIITLGSTGFFHVRVNTLRRRCYQSLFCFGISYDGVSEINDFGYPQNSEIDTLKSYITTESVMSSPHVAEESAKITVQATGATSWRPGDVKYKKNKAFVDVVETVNLSMSVKGTTLGVDVDGHIQMRAYLSGTPECKFGLNDKLLIDKSERGAGGTDAVELDDCQFCQRFELMRYRATSNAKLPLISTPLNTTTVDCKVANGKAKYIPAQNVMIWKYDSPDTRWPGECTFMASAELMSTTNRQVWARPPIDVDFQVLMFTASGLIVSFLKVFERRNYHSIKWVRYFAKASGTSDSAKYHIPF